MVTPGCREDIFRRRRSDALWRKIAVGSVGMLGIAAGAGATAQTYRGRLEACEAAASGIPAANAANATDHSAIRSDLADLKAGLARIEGRLQGVKP